MTTLRNKNILVTGGAGFVGSNLVKTLVQQHGAQVTVLDDLFTGCEENLTGIPHEFVHGSVEDKGLVSQTVKGMDIVFHLAARNIIISNNNPREDLNVNVGGTFNVFEACLEHNVERVVYTSTSSIYGNPKKLPIQEGDAKSFLNFYSAGKYSAEVYARTFYEVFQLPVSIVRYSNVYGSNQSPTNPYCGVIGKFMESALTGKPLKVHGDGGQTRDYTYIDDAVGATIAAALYPQAIGQDYNIGTGTETSVLELARMVIELTGSTSVIRHVDNRDIDNIRRRRIDISKSVKELHYTPEYNIEKGLKATVSWFLQTISKTAAGIFTVANLFVA
jgi:UDP-glucose 4-epimerase